MIRHPREFFKRHGLNPREQQLHVVDEIHKNWHKYKYFCISAGTGIGKTYIATSIADSVANSFILTSSLQLQDQYEESWDEIVNLKGRSNYTCALNSNFRVDAAPCTLKKELAQKCKEECICPYYNQKRKAEQAKAVITNPVFMLYSKHCGFAKDAHRHALIIDEAHNTEGHLVSFAECDIDVTHLEKTYSLDLSQIVITDDEGMNYEMIQRLRRLLKAEAERLQEELERSFAKSSKYNDDADLSKWAAAFSSEAGCKVEALRKKIYRLDKAIQPINIFFSTHINYEDSRKRWLYVRVPNKNAIKLTPIYADFLFDNYFGALANKFVFLSATLGSKEQFCKELGIKESECFYVHLDSPFLPENSPVVIIESIKLSKDVFEQNIKKLGPMIDAILDEHPMQRGIIHCVNYEIQQRIFKMIKAKNRKRLVCRDRELLTTGQQLSRPTNAELLEDHESNVDSVLLSPSMMEGVDLYDDLSQFQIIVKLPWGNLGDARIKRKTEIDPDWYANRMWQNMLQACGRSTRHENDKSTTYVLDSNFKYFWKKWRNKLPDQFNKRLSELT